MACKRSGVRVSLAPPGFITPKLSTWYDYLQMGKFVSFYRRHQRLIVGGAPFVSALLLAMPFLNDRFAPLSFVALLPYIWFLVNAQHKKKPRLVLSTWLMGLFFCLQVVGWLIAAETHAWTQLNGLQLRAIIFVLWLVFGLGLSLGFLILGWLLNWFRTRVSTMVWLAAVLPAAWLVCEFGRSWLFSILMYGPGASIGAFWNFGSLGLSVSSTPLVYASRLVGLFGVSALVVVVNVAIWLITTRRWRAATVGLAICAILSGLGWGLYRPASPTVRVATVQLGSSDTDYGQGLANVIGQTKAFDHQPADILVMPEYADFFESGSADLDQAIAKQVFGGRRQGLVLYSRNGPMKNGLQTNQIVATKPDGTVVLAQLKSFLVPTGEYLPWIIDGGLRLTAQRSIVDYFRGSIQVAKADHPEQVIRAPSVTIGALACSGVLAPQLYRSLVNQGAQILTNSASLNEFQHAGFYQLQARQLARLQAVAHNRALVQAARGGLSFIVSGQGRFVYDSHDQGLAIGAANVPINSSRTLYDLAGDWVVLVAAVGLVGLGVYLTRAKS